MLARPQTGAARLDRLDLGWRGPADLAHCGRSVAGLQTQTQMSAASDVWSGRTSLFPSIQKMRCGRGGGTSVDALNTRDAPAGWGIECF
jgi:hypothetical protein